MRELLYRLPRFSVKFPVDVIVGEMAILGTCKNISEAGMHGEFKQRLSLGMEGLLRLNHPEHPLEIKASVVHYTQQQISFRFEFRTEAERRKLRDFVSRVKTVGHPFKSSALPVRGLRYLPLPPDNRLR